MPKIKIESDGSKKGTKVAVNGKPVDNLHAVHFSHYSQQEAPNFQFHTAEPGDHDGMVKHSRHELTQGQIIKTDHPNIKSAVKASTKSKRKLVDIVRAVKSIKDAQKKEEDEETPEEKASETEETEASLKKVNAQYKTVGMIKKVGSQYCVFDKAGTKKLGCHPSQEEAVKQLQAVEISKHKK